MEDGYKYSVDNEGDTWAPMVLVWKRNSVERGYYEDEFMKYFSPKTTQLPLFRMTTRVQSVRQMIKQFCNLFKDQNVQVVNLGSGLDSLAMWALKNFPNAVCYDLELESQTKLKTHVLKSNPELLKMFPNYKTTDVSFHSERYHVVSCDLRHLDQVDKLKDLGFSDKLPTLYLDEYTLLFLDTEYYDNLLKHLSNFSKGPSAFVSVQWANPTGSFMKFYFSVVGHQFPMRPMFDYPNLEVQVKRHKKYGWNEMYAPFFVHFFNNLFNKDERNRLKNLEDFKRMDQFSVLCSHTMVVVALKHSGELNDFDKFVRETLMQSHEPTDDFLKFYSPKELENKDTSYLSEAVNHLTTVTFSQDSVECKQYYDKFK